MALSLDQINKKSKARAKASEKTSTKAAQKVDSPIQNKKTALARAKRKAEARGRKVRGSRVAAVEVPLTAAPETEIPIGDAQPRPQVRPWSKSGLAKSGRSPKDRIGSDHHMSDDWVGINDAPLFWVDLSSPDGRVATVLEMLARIERRAMAVARTPCNLVSAARTRLKALLK